MADLLPGLYWVNWRYNGAVRRDRAVVKLMSNGKPYYRFCNEDWTLSESSTWLSCSVSQESVAAEFELKIGDQPSEPKPEPKPKVGQGAKVDGQKPRGRKATGAGMITLRIDPILYPGLHANIAMVSRGVGNKSINQWCLDVLVAAVSAELAFYAESES